MLGSRRLCSWAGDRNNSCAGGSGFCHPQIKDSSRLNRKDARQKAKDFQV